MKILFVQDSLGAGGAERSNADLWYYLRSQGVDLKIAVLKHRAQGIEKEIVEEGFSVLFLKKGNFIQHSRELADIIREYKPDVVHSALYNSNMRVRLAKLFTPFYHAESLVNRTYDPVRYDDPKVSTPGLYLAKYIDYFSRARGVDHSIAVSQNVAHHYQDQLNIPSSSLSVINRGRNENEHLVNKEAIRTKVNEELGIGADKLLLIHVGRHEYQKGIIYFLEALQHMYENGREAWDKVEILFCGRRGNASDDIDAFMEKHPHLAQNVHWLGHRHDVPQLLAASDIFVFPSLYEGAAGALIEAQAAALPMVCSDIPVLHEVVLGGENALMFPMTNSADLYNQLTTLINNPDLRKRMGEKSLKNFREKYKLEKINEKMLDFYRRVAENTAKRETIFK